MSKRKPACLFLSCLSLALAMTTTMTANAQEAPAPNKPKDHVVQLTRETLKSVVKLYGAGGVRGIADYGTAFCVDKRGLFVTIWSVSLKTENLRIVDHLGRQFYVNIHRADPKTGIAVLKISTNQRRGSPKPATIPSDFVELPLTDAKLLPLGTSVLSFGNSFDVAVGKENPAVVEGVIAAVAALDARLGVVRRRIVGTVYLTDAANNPGTQGGPLIDMSGKAVGVNGTIVESRSTNTPINFSIPVENFRGLVKEAKENFAASKPVSADIIAIKKVHNYNLGLEVLRFYFNRPPPAYVDNVLPNSPAAKAGFKPDDLIFQINQKIVRTTKDLDAAIAELKPLSKAEIRVKRGNKIVRLTLEIPESIRTEEKPEETESEESETESATDPESGDSEKESSAEKTEKEF